MQAARVRECSCGRERALEGAAALIARARAGPERDVMLDAAAIPCPRHGCSGTNGGAPGREAVVRHRDARRRRRTGLRVGSWSGPGARSRTAIAAPAATSRDQRKQCGANSCCPHSASRKAVCQERHGFDMLKLEPRTQRHIVIDISARDERRPHPAARWPTKQRGSRRSPAHITPEPMPRRRTPARACTRPA